MRDRHAAYDALAGAIVLGEATPEERARYAAHAAGCPNCDADLDATRTIVGAAFAAGMHAETWRPFVRDGVTSRIEALRATSSRRVMTALCAAVVATVGLNLALAVGISPGAHVLPASPAAVAIHAPLAAAIRTAALRDGAHMRVERWPAQAAIALPGGFAPAAPALLVALPGPSLRSEEFRR